MVWPFRARGYEQTLTSWWSQLLELGPQADPATSVAAEAAAGFIGRCLAQATVRPAHDAVTAQWLNRVGEDMVLRGAHLSEIVVTDGVPLLEPAASWSSADENGDRVNIARMNGTNVNLPASGVLFIPWAQHPHIPFAGVGPLSNIGGQVHAGVGRSLGKETRLKTFGAVPVPQSNKTETNTVMQEAKEADGRLMLVKSTAQGWAHDGPGGAPKGDWVQRRLGPMPPKEIIDLFDSSFVQVLAACGLPAELFTGGGQGRETYRRAVATVIEPLGSRLAEAVNGAINANVKLTFSRLAAADMAGRARAAQSLTQAGWSPQEAAEAVGLDPPAERVTERQEGDENRTENERPGDDHTEQ